jgi:hypothetical protein
VGFRSVHSEVAVDILGIPQSQQACVPRTLDIAKACFKRALLDTLKAKGNEILEAGVPLNPFRTLILTDDQVLLSGEKMPKKATRI